LVIGLVGAVGTDLHAVADEVGVVLSAFDYHSHAIGLSSLLEELDWDQELDNTFNDDHIWTYMEAGNEFCRRWARNDALALLATASISEYRAEVDLPDLPLQRTAYILRSLKRPEEVEFLRGVYGSRFLLIGAYSSRPDRTSALTDAISKSHRNADPTVWHHTPAHLIERDEAENIDGGQNVRGTYHRADVFVDTRDGVRNALDRFFRGLFGDPQITPTKDEFGLFQAEAAGLRSAEMGRQVGAAIANDRGQILAVGANEVPRWNGGSYWTDDHDVPDGREIALGRDTNDVMKQELASAITERLNDQGWLKKAASLPAVVDEVSETRLGDLIEFGRATHAEMAAITDAARLGIPIGGSTLYSTTFPCHNCTRHIISAGVLRVVYVAPYAKSLALELHSDAIAVAPPTPAFDKVNFQPFVGIAPRRYMEIFKWDRKRKDRDGTVLKFDPKTAVARLADLDPAELVGDRPPYLVREALAQKLVRFMQTSTGLGLVGTD
jgi:deoxycytidylate deaminase